jgi:hypothetical protein
MGCLLLRCVRKGSRAVYDRPANEGRTLDEQATGSRDDDGRWDSDRGLDNTNGIFAARRCTSSGWTAGRSAGAGPRAAGAGASRNRIRLVCVSDAMRDLSSQPNCRSRDSRDRHPRNDARANLRFAHDRFDERAIPGIVGYSEAPDRGVPRRQAAGQLKSRQRQGYGEQVRAPDGMVGATITATRVFKPPHRRASRRPMYPS